MNSNTYKLALNFEQILELVRQLRKNDKARLSKELAKDAIDSRLTRLLNSFSTDDISEEKIIQEVENVRAEIYAEKKDN